MQKWCNLPQMKHRTKTGEAGGVENTECVYLTLSNVTLQIWIKDRSQEKELIYTATQKFRNTHVFRITFK